MGKNELTNGTVLSTADRELVMTRLLNAPKELVWKAWTDPKHLINWFGPKGYSNTFHEIDIRPGGVWKFTMHGPDGTDYPNLVVFDKIVKPDYITYTHGTFDEPEAFKVKVSFEIPPSLVGSGLKFFEMVTSVGSTITAMRPPTA